MIDTIILGLFGIFKSS